MKKLKEQKQDTLAIAKPHPLNIHWALVLLIFMVGRAPGEAHAKYVKSVTCEGVTSSNSLIFLHGIDSPRKPDAANSSAYQVIKKISSSLKVRLALPRSNTPCKQGRKICWNVSNQVEDLKKIYTELNNKSAPCFQKQSKPMLAAFSNGGYFLNKLVHHCLLPKDTIVISIGAAGNVRSNAPLTTCGSLDLVLGKYESTYSAGVKYYLRMKSLNAKVTLTKFNGGHMVPYDPLFAIIKKNIKSVQ